jgi:putative intracellular protease/amidase
MAAATVHMAVYDTLVDWEVGFATAHINNSRWQRQPGRYEVVTIGATAAPVTTMGGVRLTPDVTLDDLDPEDSAMLILAGADTWETGDNEAFAREARTLLETGTPVAAICGATWGLAAEGLLDERRHTSNAREYLAATGYHGGEHYVDELAVTEGAVVTASGIAPVEFAREVFGVLELFEPGVLASWYKLYGRHDPAGYAELAGRRA